MSASWELTDAQRGIWYAGRLSPDPAAYVTADCIRGPATLDAARVAAAVAATVAEIPGLRVRVVEDGDRLIQVLEGPSSPLVPVIDCESAAAAEAWMIADCRRPIDPCVGPLCRQAVLRVAEVGVWWYQAIHHLATDAYATGQIARRVAAHYDRPGTPPRARIEGVERLLEVEHAYRGSVARRDDLEYWRATMAGCDGAVGPTGGTPTTVARPLRADRPSGRLPDPSLVIAAVALWLHRITHRTDIVLGMPWMGRMGSVAARVPSAWVNLLPIRLEVDPGMSIGRLSAQATRALRDAGTHGRLRYEQIAQELGYLGSGRRLLGPLVNIKPFAARVTMGGHELTIDNLSAGPIEDISVTVAEGLLRLEGHPAHYGPGDLEGHAARLAQVLERIDADQDIPTARIPVATDVDRCRELSAAAGPRVAVPPATLWSGFAAQAARHPERVAVEDDSVRLSYRQLQDRALAMAGRLAALGAGPGRVIGVRMERSAELLVALLAILRCGAAYLPLEPDQPAARTDLMCEDARPALVVEGEIATGHVAPLGPGPDPADIAYVLYTSGSTGRPKGVRVGHGAIVNRLAWIRQIQGFGADERVLLKTPLGFDVSVWELFWALQVGATVVVAPPGIHRDPAGLVEQITRRRITVAHFVPSMLKAFLAEPGAQQCRGLAHIVCSGEALSAVLAQECRRLLPGVALDNLYGPTEAAVDVTAWRVGPADTQVVPIGRPVWNTHAYVLDMADQLAPPGAVGHLHLAGDQLACDYLGRPDLTDERFVPDPFGAPGTRMYRTGDLVRRRPDGALEYLGRNDDQVKVRGVRIELGEVEAAVAGHRSVAQAVAVVRPDGPGGEPWLVVYVVARMGEPLDPEHLRAHAAERLPATMMPGAVVVLEQIPTGSTGKLDRAALPPPTAHTSSQGPADLWQEEICAHMAEALGLERVGADDNFFRLGGSSLVAARLVGRLRETWEGEVNIGTIFAHPTPAAIARALREGDANPHHPVLVLRRGVGAPIVCVHPAGGLGWCYAPLAGLLPPGRTVIALQSDRADHPTMRDLAEVYVDRLLEHTGGGPHHLVGWSVGGVIAHAMAARLLEWGERVGVLALLDAYPSEQWRHLPPPGPREAREALLTMAGLDPAGAAGGMDEVHERLVQANSALAGLGPAELEAVTTSVMRTAALMRTVDHERYPGDLLFFTAAAPRPEGWLDRGGWARHVGGQIANHDVQCTHPAMVRAPFVTHIAALLGQAIGPLAD